MVLLSGEGTVGVEISPVKKSFVQSTTQTMNRVQILFTVMSVFNPLSPGVKLQILLLCFHTFLTEVVGRSC